MKACDTQIYAATYKLSSEIVSVARHFPRDLKPGLGFPMIDISMRMVLSVYRANFAREGRAEIIEKLLEDLHVLELAVRLSSDQGNVSREKHGEIIELTDSIGRQAYRWMQDAQRRQAPRNNSGKRHGQNG
ncbi:four helix bundle protein [Halomonas sp. MES3-P3E]|uniref:four helix bundle protein n=1 Tax=Halomonas sp. MES3-P3E TaxID=2058321 RepID=UPI000C349BE7|nr:four helix bundle protein [Halomonas sp. MES3-P3E]PKG50330.1 hypothetical protein CXF87_11355 [Halomonas sp. MES3-P3E]